jgi:hypothetical protein
MGFDRTRLPEPAAYFEAQGLHLIGKSKWRTTECTFHGGSDSMRINTVTGSWVCMSCAAKGGDVLAYEIAANSTPFIDACKALGTWVEDGTLPPKPRATRLSAAQAVQAIYLETWIVAIIAADLAKGLPFTDAYRQSLTEAARVITHLSGAFQ